MTRKSDTKKCPVKKITDRVVAGEAAAGRVDGQHAALVGALYAALALTQAAPGGFKAQNIL